MIDQQAGQRVRSAVLVTATVSGSRWPVSGQKRMSGGWSSWQKGQIMAWVYARGGWFAPTGFPQYWQ